MPSVAVPKTQTTNRIVIRLRRLPAVRPLKLKSEDPLVLVNYIAAQESAVIKGAGEWLP